MKYIIAFISALTIAGHVQAQNVGIGTTSPHSSAALHINSTTRGFLPPRMTTIQRNAIASPLNGLMIYDTDLERVYTFADGTWRYIITNEIWANNETAIYQTSRNVGIGTAAPQEKLHVIGNIRTSGNFLSSGEIIVNNDAGILTFQNAGVDKTFVQLSGENLRVGTFSANNTGQFIVRTNGSDRFVVGSSGNVGVANSNPLQRLDVNGNINLTGQVLRTDKTGLANMLPVAYGVITSDGTLYSGTENFTITKSGTGIYTLTSADFSPATTIVSTPAAVNVQTGAAFGPGANQLTIYVRNTDTGALINAFFNFVAFTF